MVYYNPQPNPAGVGITTLTPDVINAIHKSLLDSTFKKKRKYSIIPRNKNCFDLMIGEAAFVLPSVPNHIFLMLLILLGLGFSNLWLKLPASVTALASNQLKP